MKMRSGLYLSINRLVILETGTYMQSTVTFYFEKSRLHLADKDATPEFWHN